MRTDKFPYYSGIEFIPDNACVIEESPMRLDCGDGVRSVEFIRRKDLRLLFIEAKTTIPNPANSSEPYAKEINRICEKFIHSLNLLAAVKTGIREDVFVNEFAIPNKTILKFVLVVNKHKAEWCKPVKRKIEQTLPTYFKKIWRPEIYVINHEMAVKNGIAAR